MIEMMMGPKKEYLDQCDTTETTAAGFKVFVHKKKGLNTQSPQPGIMFFHGAAFILWNAEAFQPEGCEMAVMSDCVILNIDYGKCP